MNHCNSQRMSTIIKQIGYGRSLQRCKPTVWIHIVHNVPMVRCEVASVGKRVFYCNLALTFNTALLFRSLESGLTSAIPRWERKRLRVVGATFALREKRLEQATNNTRRLIVRYRSSNEIERLIDPLCWNPKRAILQGAKHRLASFSALYGRLWRSIFCTIVQNLIFLITDNSIELWVRSLPDVCRMISNRRVSVIADNTNRNALDCAVPFLSFGTGCFAMAVPSLAISRGRERLLWCCNFMHSWDEKTSRWLSESNTLMHTSSGFDRS